MRKKSRLSFLSKVSNYDWKLQSTVLANGQTIYCSSLFFELLANIKIFRNCIEFRKDKDVLKAFDGKLDLVENVQLQKTVKTTETNF